MAYGYGFGGRWPIRGQYLSFPSLANGRRRITNSSYGGVLNSSLFAQHLGKFPSQISPTPAQRVFPHTLADRDLFLGTTRALYFSVGLCINNS